MCGNEMLETTLCETCGVTGFADLLVYCSECQISAEHRYCMDRIPHSDELEIHWLCAECKLSYPEVGLAGILNIDSEKNKHGQNCQNQQPNIVDNVSRETTYQPAQITEKVVSCLKSHNGLSSGSEGDAAIEFDVSEHESCSSVHVNRMPISAREKGIGNGLYVPGQCTKENNSRKTRKLILEDEDLSDEETPSDRFDQDVPNQRTLQFNEPLAMGYAEDCQNQQINKVDNIPKQPTYWSSHIADKIVSSLKSCNETTSGSEVMNAIESDVSKYNSCSSDMANVIAIIGTSDLVEKETENGMHKPRECTKNNSRKRRKLILVEEDQLAEETQHDRFDQDVLEQRFFSSLKSHNEITGGSEVKNAIEPDISKYKSSIPNMANAITIIGTSDSMAKEVGNAMHTPREHTEKKKSRKRRKLILAEEDQSDEETQYGHFDPNALNQKTLQLNEPLMESGHAEDSAKASPDVQIDSSGASDTQLNMSCHQVSIKEAGDLHARPIFYPSWRGCFNICDESYGPLTAHLSNKACDKVCTLSQSLPPVFIMEKVLRIDAWPNSFRKSPPTDDNIALYFLPSDARVEPGLDQLLDDVINNDLVLKIIVDDAELLVFSSVILPEDNHRFRGRYYLWGVFRPRQIPDPNIPATCLYNSNELRGERYKEQSSNDLREEVEADGEKSSDSFSNNGSDASPFILKLFGTEILAHSLSSDCPSDLKVHKPIGEEGARSDVEHLNYADQTGGNAPMPRSFNLFGWQVPVPGASDCLSEPTDLDKEENVQDNEPPEGGKLIHFIDKHCVHHQMREDGWKGKEESETLKPFFHVFDTEEDGACLDLFPQRVVDMAFAAKVGGSTDLDLKLGLCC